MRRFVGTCLVLLTATLPARGTAIGEPAFADPRLEVAIREAARAKPGPLTAEALARVRSLDIRNLDIERLDGIEALERLRVLRADGNLISDLGPLAGLTALVRIDMTHNRVEEVTPLAGLTKLRVLKLDGNLIRDIGPVASLPGLTRLTVEGNPIAAAIDLPALYRALREVMLDESAVADVAGLALTKDAATFRLDEGKLYFARPHAAGDDSVTTAALFVGRGTLEMTPPTRVEREQLARFRDGEALSQPFEVLYLRYTDEALRARLAALPTREAPVTARVRRELDYARNYTAGDDALFLEMTEDIASGAPEGLVYAHVGKRRSTSAGYLPKPDFFLFAPRRVEEVRFDTRRPVDGSGYYRQTICQFHRASDYASGKDLADETKAVVEPTHYAGKFDITGDGRMQAEVSLDFTVMAAEAHAVSFSLLPGLEVEGMTRGDRPVSFERRKGSTKVIAFLDPPGFVGTNDRLTLRYAGKVLTREDGTFYAHSSGLWYPRFPGAPKSTFDLTFTSPARYDFIAAGERVSEASTDGKRVTRWVHRSPAVNTSFSIGSFKTFETEAEGVPVSIHMSEGGHREIQRRLARAGVKTGRSMDREIAADVANSVRLFSRLFGPYPYDRLAATEIPYAHGEAFPGFLHLSIATFLQTDDKGEGIAFRAHEVAHQWWGTTLRFKTYRDQWLSEGFAEYSGLWYVQAAMGDNQKFFELLEDWRDRIFSNRKYVLGSGTEAGPIWLGRRTQTAETAGDYGLIIYKKGAWVLHMLRNMFLDPGTLTDRGFAAAMRAFYQKYRDRPASTEDFRRVVEEHYGEDLGWFFDQWVYGTDLPTYRYGHVQSQTIDGRWMVTVRVRQEDVPEAFRMPVPVTVYDAQQTAHRSTMWVEGRESVVELGPFDAEPAGVTLNDFQSVLAKVVR